MLQEARWDFREKAFNIQITEKFPKWTLTKSASNDFWAIKSPNEPLQGNKELLELGRAACTKNSLWHREARCKVSPKDQVLEKAECGIKQAGVIGEILHNPRAALAQRCRGFTNLLGGLTQLVPGAGQLFVTAEISCQPQLLPEPSANPGKLGHEAIQFF